MKRSYSKIRKNVVESAKGTFWVSYFALSDSERQEVLTSNIVTAEFYENIFDEHEISQTEKHGLIRSLLLQVPVRSTQQTMPLAIIKTKASWITIAAKDIPYIANTKMKLDTKDLFLSELGFLIEEEYERVLKHIAKKVRQKKRSLVSLHERDILDLVEIEDELNTLLTSLVPNINVYDRLLKGKFLPLSVELKESLEDVQLDARQNAERAKVLLKTVQNIRNAYSAILTNKLNQVMKVLTVTTILIAIPTLFASVYGMNIDLPWQHSPSILVMLLLVCALMVLLVVLVFKLKKWV